ncbi:type VI secretion system tip protein TssI/VgrG [Pseudomonas sp. MAG733B]|uniref:type VI secretion system tip protein TssI/VgrG n=1 Tax=Pseudomonas sp. MAG733B TaxID=3122079 RepID=UPI0030D321ED
MNLVPALHNLQFRHDHRIFQDQTVPQIITQVLKRHGILADAFAFHVKTGAPRNYCTQYGETDFEFVQRLCAEDGIAWHHQHSREGHLLVFTDDQTYFPKLGETPYLDGSGMVAEHPVVSRFSRRFSMRTSGTTQRHYDRKRPNRLLESRVSTELWPALEDYRYPLFSENENHGKQLARQTLERHRVDYQLAEGTSDQPYLRSGHFFNLTDHPRETCNDLWLLLSVSHHGKQPQVLEESITSIRESEDDFTQGYRNSFSAIPWDVFYRPPLPSQRTPLVCQTARVTGPPGQEIYCDDYGRVKVEFHWDRAERNNEHSSCWLRVSTGWAGEGFGAVTVPRVGMEVIVTYLDGNPDYPLITGCLPNRVMSQPYPLPENKTRTVLRSRSSPHNGGYNELSIEDRAGQELVYLRAQRDMEQKVGNDSRLEVGNERRETIKGNSISVLEAEEHHTVNGDRKVRVNTDDYLHASNHYTNVDQTLVVEAGQHVHIKAGSNLVVDGGESITLKAGGHHIVMNANGIFSSSEIKVGGSPRTGKPAQALLVVPAAGLLASVMPAPSAEQDWAELEEEEEEVELQGITLRIGVFFDGTGNNKANSETVAACYAPDVDLAEVAEDIRQHCARYGYDGDGSSPDNSYGNDVSNIARLYELYTDHSYSLVPETSKTASIAVYIDGIGTRHNKTDSIHSQMMGIGETGVVARVEQSPEKIVKQLRLLQKQNPNVIIEKIEFDIFGFSRGAAAARHFANEVLKGEHSILANALPPGSPALSGSFNWRLNAEVTINFIGLFDTVAAIANPLRFDFTLSNNNNPGVNLMLPDGCANKVVHLVARDEIRENFALNSLGSLDIVLPGVHSDLGGGYLPRAREKLLLSKPATSEISRGMEETRSFAYLSAEKEMRAWYDKGVIDFDGSRKELRVVLWDRPIEPSREHPYPRKKLFAAAGIERQVHGELSLVYLRIMRELAIKHDVPFKVIPDIPTLVLPEELVPIHKKLQAYALGESPAPGLMISEVELLRRRYIHLSAHWNAAKGLNSSDMSVIFINRPTEKLQRVVHPNE